MKPSEVIRMISSKSLRLILTNITERVVFDLMNGVDTITQAPKEAFPNDLVNVEHGRHYSSSWTSEIIYGFRVVQRLLGEKFQTYSFVDVGCGRGKVPIVWSKLLRRGRLRQRVTGLEYFSPLIADAETNFLKATGQKGEFIHGDASLFDFATLGRDVIIYFFNSTDQVVLAAMLDNLRTCDVVFIYNHPVYHDLMIRNGFTVVEEKRGFHPQAVTIVYERRANLSIAV